MTYFRTQLHIYHKQIKLHTNKKTHKQSEKMRLQGEKWAKYLLDNLKHGSLEGKYTFSVSESQRHISRST